DRTPSLAKRIELSLYSRAASFNEYRDLNTLRRRLQSLVSLSFHEAAVSRKAAMESCATKLLGKRKLKATPFGVSRLMIKRPRNAPPMMVPSSTTIATSHNHHRQQSHRHHHHHRSQLVCSASVAATQTFFITNEDVLRQIFAYLPGVDTVRSFAVNRFAARVLPTCVFSLDVEVKAMKRAYENASPSFL
ncbi:hypothetical protein Gpo141_00015177, partial [Globisporangium polare]